MPAVPDPLAAEQCPILKHDRYAAALGPVLAVFNAAAAAARKLADKYPHALQSPEVADALDRLAAARATLTTPRFKVGFLGPFQCGKSTILNNLLGQDISAVGVDRPFEVEPAERQPLAARRQRRDRQVAVRHVEEEPELL